MFSYQLTPRAPELLPDRGRDAVVPPEKGNRVRAI